MSLVANLINHISCWRTTKHRQVKHTAVSTQNPLLVLQLQTLQNLMDSIAAGIGSNDSPFRGEIVKLGDDTLLQLEVFRDALFSCEKIVGIHWDSRTHLDDQPGVLQFGLQ